MKNRHIINSCVCIFINNRNSVMDRLRAMNIEVQIGTYALHMQQAFAKNPFCQIIGDMSGSRYAFDHCLALPLYHDLNYIDQEYIIDKLIELIS